MIEVENLSKRYGDKVAVDGLTFTVQPGVVTGFLGPNGAGKPVTELWHSLSPKCGGSG
jgi:ABC-2 type transport system ATP-binding protein